MSFFLHKKWRGILGMNARTLEYISKANPPEAVRIANNKLRTKAMLQREGVNTPRLFSVIKTRSELQRFRWTKLPSSFVLKPTSSSGGGGIVVMFGRNKKGNWVKANKSEVFIPELRRHILDILDGNFSKGNVPDTAFFEQRVRVHPSQKQYSVKGIPDIRVIVYHQIPIMAMLRLPTEESDGRANLHMGGIGVGIDIATGKTTTAIYRGDLIDTLPHTRLKLSGVQIPYWEDILLFASRSSLATGLNYVGVDIAIDRDDGPLVLEINARPGLEIQFANLSPLKSRLKQAEGFKSKSLEKKISLAKTMFGIDADQEQQGSYEKSILNLEEDVEIMDNEGKIHIVKAKIDTGAYRTTIDKKLAKTLDIDKPILEYKYVRGALGRQKRPIVSLTFKLRNKSIKTEVSLIDRSHMKYDIILGTKDLQGFLIKPDVKP